MSCSQLKTIERTAISLTAGSWNRPASSRLHKSQNPCRSHTNIFIRSRRRFKKTNRLPDSGSCPRYSRTSPARPSYALRMSVGREHKNIETPPISPNISGGLAIAATSKRLVSSQYQEETAELTHQKRITQKRHSTMMSSPAEIQVYRTSYSFASAYLLFGTAAATIQMWRALFYGENKTLSGELHPTCMIQPGKTSAVGVLLFA